MTQPSDAWQTGELVRVVDPQRSPTMNDATLGRAFDSSFDPPAKPTPDPSPHAQPKERDPFGGSDVIDSLSPDLKKAYFAGDRDAVAQVTGLFRQQFPGEQPTETSESLLPSNYHLSPVGPTDVFSPAFLKDTASAMRASGVNAESGQGVLDWIGGLKDHLPLPEPSVNQIDTATAARTLQAEYGQNLNTQLSRAKDALAVAAAYGSKSFGPEAAERLTKLEDYLARTGIGNNPAAARYLVKVADWLDRNNPSLMSNARAWRRSRSR